MALEIFDSEYDAYRERLNQYEKLHAPRQLYWEGDFSLLNAGKRVSVVGSRTVSSGGLSRARALSKKLVAQGITVVSGLAEGIDTTVHQTAMEEGGKTIAVLGTPLDKPYPAKNKGLLETTKREHLAISQFPTAHPFDPINFLNRNRTMAMISDATVMVEATENSGIRHMGWEGLRLGRNVFIMANVFETPSITWPQEILKYGAEVMTEDNLNDLLADIPNYTTEITFEL